jgi:hypothetical protein
VECVRSRLVVVAAALVVGALAVVVSSREDSASTQTESVRAYIDANRDTWKSEDLYRAILNRPRAGGFHDLETGRAIYTNRDRVRVLVIGDSFTYGTGLVDLSARWPALLEAELDAATQPGTFEVVAVSHGGTSTHNHAAWAHLLAAGDYKSIPINPPPVDLRSDYDAFVLGYVENDRFPGFNDRTIPEPLQSVAAAAGFADPTQFFEVDWTRHNAVLYNGAPDPNGPLWAPTVQYLRDAFPSIPAIWLPLAFFDQTRAASLAEAPVFAAAGFTIASTEAIESLIATETPETLMVTAVDTHPGTAMLHAYARDAAAAVLASVDPDRVAAAIAAASPAVRPIVGFVAPGDATATSTAKDATVDLPDTATVERECATYGANGSMADCIDGSSVFVFSDQGVQATLENGYTAPAQFVPCLAVGRPHAAVSFDPAIIPGQRIVVRLPAQTNTHRWLVYAFGYDERGFEVISEFGAVAPGGSITVQTGPTNRGLYFAPADAPASCSVGDVALSLPAAQFTFTLSS